jgi:hypothetical protein
MACAAMHQQQKAREQLAVCPTWMNPMLWASLAE